MDPGGSRVLQALLPQAPLGVLGQILPPLVSGGLGGPAGHPLGARVLEAALGRVLPALGEAVGPVKEQEEEAVGPVEEAVGRLAAAVRDDPVAFARHPAGSFVVRALLRVLGGAPGAGEATGKGLGGFGGGNGRGWGAPGGSAGVVWGWGGSVGGN